MDGKKKLLVSLQISHFKTEAKNSNILKAKEW